MNKKKFQSQTQKASDIVTKICGSAQKRFSSLKPTDIDVSIPGVYVIATTEDEILYVGKASNLRRRIYTNHLQGNLSTAMLKKYLIEDVHLPAVSNQEEAKAWIKANCYFKYLPEHNERERAMLESLLTFYLSPRYVELVR